MPEAKDHSRVTPQGRAMGKSAARLAEQGLQRLQALGLGSVEGPGVRGEMCTTCACRPGSVPNGCLQTQLDFLKAAAEGRPMQGMVATLTAAGAELARLTHTRITRMASSSLVLAGVETMPDGLAHEQEWWCRQVSGGPPRPYDPDPPSAVARDLSYAPWTSPEWMPA